MFICKMIIYCNIGNVASNRIWFSKIEIRILKVKKIFLSLFSFGVIYILTCCLLIVKMLCFQYCSYIMLKFIDYCLILPSDSITSLECKKKKKNTCKRQYWKEVLPPNIYDVWLFGQILGIALRIFQHLLVYTNQSLANKLFFFKYKYTNNFRDEMVNNKTVLKKGWIYAFFVFFLY